MSRQSEENYGTLISHRFVTKRLPRSLGLVLALICGPVCAMMILSIIGEHSVIMIIISILLALLFGAAFVIGVLAILASREKVWFSDEGIRIRLGKLTLWKIPRERIRSVVAGTREVRLGFGDRQVVMLRVYSNGGIFKGRMPFWMEWSPEAEDAFRRKLPNINLLL